MQKQVVTNLKGLFFLFTQYLQKIIKIKQLSSNDNKKRKEGIMNEIDINKILNEKNVTIKKAAQMMGKSEQFIRIGLRNNRLPFRYSS